MGRVADFKNTIMREHNLSERHRKLHNNVGILRVVAGSVSLILEIVIIIAIHAKAKSEIEYFDRRYHGLWMSALIIIAGICGIYLKFAVKRVKLILAAIIAIGILLVFLSLWTIIYISTTAKTGFKISDNCTNFDCHSEDGYHLVSSCLAIQAIMFSIEFIADIVHIVLSIKGLCCLKKVEPQTTPAEEIVVEVKKTEDVKQEEGKDTPSEIVVKEMYIEPNAGEFNEAYVT